MDTSGAIVVGVDGSDFSKRALRWAFDEAKLRGTEVIRCIRVDVPRDGKRVAVRIFLATNPCQAAAGRVNAFGTSS